MAKNQVPSDSLPTHPETGHAGGVGGFGWQLASQAPNGGLGARGPKKRVVDTPLGS